MRVRPFLAVSVSICLIGIVAAGCRIEIDPGQAGDFEPATAGVLTVATEHVPAAGFWLGTRKKPTGGFEFELAEAMALQFDLDRVEIRTVPLDRLIKGDLAGADIALRQLTPTSEREEYLDFSIPYLSSPPAALVRAGQEIPDMLTARELSWAVPEGTTLIKLLEDTVRPETMRIAETQVEVVRMLGRGDVDAALFDLPVALAMAQASAGRFEVAAQFASDEALAVALPRGSDNVEGVNSAIRALSAEGTISDLTGRWLDVSVTSTSFSVSNVPLIR